MLPLQARVEPGSDDNEGLLHIPQNSSITGTSPSDCLVSYTGHSLEESYSSADMQSVYSTAPADLATGHLLEGGVIPDCSEAADWDKR